MIVVDTMVDEVVCISDEVFAALEELLRGREDEGVLTPVPVPREPELPEMVPLGEIHGRSRAVPTLAKRRKHRVCTMNEAINERCMMLKKDQK